MVLASARRVRKNCLRSPKAMFPMPLRLEAKLESQMLATLPPVAWATSR